MVFSLQIMLQNVHTHTQTPPPSATPKGLYAKIYIYNTLTVYPKKYSTDQTTKYNSQTYAGIVNASHQKCINTVFIQQYTAQPLSKPGGLQW